MHICMHTHTHIPRIQGQLQLLGQLSAERAAFASTIAVSIGRSNIPMIRRYHRPFWHSCRSLTAQTFGTIYTILRHERGAHTLQSSSSTRVLQILGQPSAERAAFVSASQKRLCVCQCGLRVFARVVYACVCMCVCMCIFVVYVCKCVCVCVSVYACVDLCVYACSFVRAHGICTRAPRIQMLWESVY